MSDVSLHQLLVLYTWFPLAALLAFLLLIARFYQKFSNIRTYYWLFLGVIVLFGFIAVRSAGRGLVIGDNSVEIIRFIVGVLLTTLVVRLYSVMMNSQNELE